MKNKIIITLSIIAIIISLIIGINVRDSEEGILFDVAIMEYVHDNITPEVFKFMEFITFFGSAYFFILTGIITFLFIKKKNNSGGIILLLSSTLGSYILNFILKNIFTRMRPLEYFLIQQGGYSFPSGHSMISMSFYTAMTYLITKNKNNAIVKIILWVLNFIIVAVIGFSRIYLGVHWPTDVLIGFLLGLIYTYASIKIIKN